jgi:hypothetical protein
VSEEFRLTGGASLEQGDGRLNLLLRTDEADRSLVSLPDSRGEVKGFHRQESLGPKPLQEGGGHLPELPSQATDRDRDVWGEEAEQLLFPGSEVMGPLCQSLVSLFGEANEAAGRGINPWRERRLDCFSPRRPVVFGHPSGQIQHQLVQEGFRVHDVLQRFEIGAVGCRREPHEVAGDDPGTERDNHALAGSSRLAQMGGDGIGENLINGSRQGDFGVRGTICWSHHVFVALLTPGTLGACPHIFV